MVRLRLAGPTWAVRSEGEGVGISVASGSEVGTEVSADGEDAVMKSSREGPTLRRSLKAVRGRRIEGLGSGAAVAKDWELGVRGAVGEVKGEDRRQRNRGAFEAMMVIGRKEEMENSQSAEISERDIRYQAGSKPQ